MTDTDTDAERPEQSSQADVTLVTRGITLTACVEVSSDFALVVRPDDGGRVGQSVKPGDPVEVYWVSGYEERTLPAKVASVETGIADDGTAADPRWQLSPTGPAERSQRRKAVRARLAVPVVIPWAGAVLTGTTVDLSEGGMKALVDGWGLPPEPGTSAAVSLSLDDGALDLQGEVVWYADRGGQWILAVRFEDVPDKTADRLRRRVFQALREERAAATA
jgi:PilZ domain